MHILLHPDDRGDVPEPDALIVAARCQQLAVAGKRHGANAGAVAPDDRGFTAAIPVRELQCPIVAGLDQEPAVRRERDTGNATGESGQARAQPPARRSQSWIWDDVTAASTSVCPSGENAMVRE